MAQIPSWLWLFAGILVTAGSYYVGGKIALFFYLGLLFLLIGVAKVIIWFVMRKSTKIERKQIRMPQPRTQPVQPIHGQYGKCRWCGKIVRRTDSFCWGCGRRLR